MFPRGVEHRKHQTRQHTKQGEARLQVGLMANLARGQDTPPTPEICAGQDGPTSAPLPPHQTDVQDKQHQTNNTDTRKGRTHSIGNSQ